MLSKISVAQNYEKIHEKIPDIMTNKVVLRICLTKQ